MWRSQIVHHHLFALLNDTALHSSCYLPHPQSRTNSAPQVAKYIPYPRYGLAIFPRSNFRIADNLSNSQDRRFQSIGLDSMLNNALAHKFACCIAGI